jgi:hypothetical protein
LSRSTLTMPSEIVRRPGQVMAGRRKFVSEA